MDKAAILPEESLSGGDKSDGGSTRRQFKVLGGGEQFIVNHVLTSQYTVLNFVPLFLLRQFSRAANVYFLTIGVLQVLPVVSTTFGVPVIALPLLFVLGVSALKEIVEDIRRHRDDAETNGTVVQRLTREGTMEDTTWGDLRVGDVVRVDVDQQFPADLLLLGASIDADVEELQDGCFVTTKNLDGETNLKPRTAVAETVAIMNSAERLTGDSSLRIDCELPNARLEEFVGTLWLPDGCGVPLGMDNMLLRGCSLRNTEWVVGVVVFSGHDTKVFQNAHVVQAKISTLDSMLNGIIGKLLVLQQSLCLLLALGSVLWTIGAGKGHSYLAFADGYGVSDFFIAYLVFVQRFTNLIPISLYVMVEIVKVAQTYFIEADVQMYHAPLDQPAKVRTSSLLEELGQIEHIFSDKTGTLTCNQMDFAAASIGGMCYGMNAFLARNDAGGNARGCEEEGDDGDDRDDLPVAARKKVEAGGKVAPEEDADDSDAAGSSAPGKQEQLPHVDLRSRRLQQAVERGDEDVTRFMLALSLCHSILVEADGHYSASSPDELALVYAARQYGFKFTKSFREELHLEVNGATQIYDLLHVLPFTSARKRMSVIVRDRSDGRVRIICKGADSVIFERIAEDDPLRSATDRHLSRFADSGLRTLCVAEAELDDDWYADWSDRYSASLLMVEEVEKQAAEEENLIDALAAEVESNLRLLGATGIEDKLQDKVPYAISQLQAAGIKLWVLTGDKVETAINIGLSSKLLSHEQRLFVMRSSSADRLREQLNEWAHQMSAGVTSSGYSLLDSHRPALVLAGPALTCILADEELQLQFVKLSRRCVSVLCCRISPKQKAMVVRMVKKHDAVRTLAIGDGANDVSMIQAADVGVGVFGLEGRQAVNSSDYAVAQFHFLYRLLIVHGRWSYRRICKLTAYMFYKNACLVLTQLWFNLDSAFSGQNITNEAAMGLFNICYSSLPIMLFAIFDQDVPDHISLREPRLYCVGRLGRGFTPQIMLHWMLSAVYHSAICYYLPTSIFSTVFEGANPMPGGLELMGAVVLTAVIIVINGRVAMEMNTWVIFSSGGFLAGYISWLVAALILSTPAWSVALLVDWNLLMHRLMGSVAFWLVQPLVLFVALMPNVLMRCYLDPVYELHRATVEKFAAIDNAAHAEKSSSGLVADSPRSSVPSGSKRPESVRVITVVSRDDDIKRGYAFSETEGGGRERAPGLLVRRPSVLGELGGDKVDKTASPSPLISRTSSDASGPPVRPVVEEGDAVGALVAPELSSAELRSYGRGRRGRQSLSIRMRPERLREMAEAHAASMPR